MSTDALAPHTTFELTIMDVTDAVPNTIVPNPTICLFTQGPFDCEDFSGGLPAGSSSTGTTPPYVRDGILHLTDNGVTGNQNFWTVLLPGGTRTLPTFNATWRTLLNGPIGNAADGFSFNVGVGPFTYANGVAEQGATAGLSVTVDTFNNAEINPAEVGIEVRWNGVRLAFTQVPPGTVNGPAALMRNQFVDANVAVSSSGAVTFNYDTFSVSAEIPDFTGISADRYVFAARTGGAAEDAWIDDLCVDPGLVLGPVAVTLSGCPTGPIQECNTVTFTAVATGSPELTYRWLSNGVPIVGATGPSYTTPVLRPANDGDIYTVEVQNAFSMASAVCTLDVTPDTTPPTIVSVGALNPTSVGVCFSEAVHAATATAVGNYSINGGAAGAGIASIRLREDGRSVALTLSTPLTNCGPFMVSATGVLDACPALNSAPSMGTGSIIGGLSGVDVGTAGDPVAPGGNSVSCADGSIEIVARGGDMWGNADHLQFAQTQVAGDFDMIVKVESLECTARWAKAGLGARATLDADSAAITTYLNPLGPCGANQIESGARPTTGAGMNNWNDAPYNGSGEIYPRPLASDFRWIRLQRAGNRFIAYHSVDGTPGSWIEHADSGVVPGIPLSLYVGLVTTPNNGNSGVPTKAVFSGFSLGTGASVTRAGNMVNVSWIDPCAVLQTAPALGGPWMNVVGGSPRMFDVSSGTLYFRTIR